MHINVEENFTLKITGGKEPHTVQLIASIFMPFAAIDLQNQIIIFKDFA